MKLKYVGLKESETAFSPETGIVWTPGSSHDVPDPIATKMLLHPDVFARDTGKTAAAATQVAQAASTGETTAAVAGAVGAGAVIGSGAMVPSGSVPADAQHVIAAPSGPIALDHLDRDTLFALCKELNVKVHPQSGVPKLIEALKKAFPIKAKK